MPEYPITAHNWSSRAEPIENVGIDTTESGEQHGYLQADDCWYDVTLVSTVYHDVRGEHADLLDQFYQHNKLSESISFSCKNYRYVGLFTKPPQIEQLQGFGIWALTSRFRAQRTSRIPIDSDLPTFSYKDYYLARRGSLDPDALYFSYLTFYQQQRGPL